MLLVRLKAIFAIFLMLLMHLDTFYPITQVRSQGNPVLKIILAKNASLVYPGGNVEFRFLVRNEGSENAYGVKIWIRVDPPTEIQFLVPSRLGRVLTGYLSEPITLIQHFPNGTVVDYPLPPSGYTQDYGLYS